MKGFPEEFDSIFRYIEVVSQRAAQMINGARPRAESKFFKPTLISKDEVDEGLVQWRVLTQEELEARRQALVEQFKAEMAPESEVSEESTAADVLPTTVAASSQEQPEVEQVEEHDEDLLRLQRLIGFTGDVADSGNDEEAGAVEETVVTEDSGENAED